MSALQVVSAEEEAELGGSPDAAKKGRKQSERLNETVAAADVELFHDAEFRTYATFKRDGHRETWPIRSQGFRHYLSYLYYLAAGEPPRAQVLADFLNVLEGRAKFDGAMENVFVRISRTPAGGTVIDLGDAEWSVVEVAASGWNHVAASPVKFLRPRGLWPLPAPERGGSLDLLRPFLNVADEDQWRLLVGFLVGMFRSAGPYPVLALHGEQGAAKTTAMRVLRKLVDPRQALDRAAPRDEHDLAIHAMHNWTIALDNVSGLPDWLSDALARLATGSGWSTRELYTDSEEFTFSAARPVMLNGIGEVIDRSDLLDRALLVNLAPISEQGRRLEEEFWSDFEEARPRILGALLDAVAGALGRVDSVRLASLPRMADFARFVTAAEPALNWEAGSFLRAYYANRGSAHELALDADPVADALRQLLFDEGSVWEGRPTALLEELGRIAGETATKQRNWPKAAHVLTNRLVRLGPNLRAIGIEVVHDRSGTARTIRVSKAGNGASRASRASSFEREPGVPRDAHDARDAGRKAPGVETVPGPASDLPVGSDAATAPDAAGPNYRVDIGPDEWQAESSRGIEDSARATEGAGHAELIEPPILEIESGLDPSIVAAYAVFGADIVLAFPPPEEAVPHLLASAQRETSDASQPAGDHLDLGEGHLLDLPIEEDYPPSAWDTKGAAEDSQVDLWPATTPADFSGGAS